MTIHSVVIQKLLSTNAHLGRRVAAHHFKIYTYGSRNAMSIMDSDKTLICLRNACDFIGNLVKHKGRFLFVNTNQLFDEIIDQMTQKIGVKNDNSWRLGGFLTNSLSPRKFRSRNKKLNLGSIQPPDCVVIMDTERKSSVIYEADRLQIPIVGLVDSSMPWDVYKRITYPVPANDSVQFVYLFCNLITKTFLYEQKKLGGALGNVGQIAEGKTREATQPIEDSKITCATDEIFVLPYESLVPPPDDPLEIKKIVDKLVVVKSNSGLDTKIGFDGPTSLIEVRNGLTCLDLIANHIESLNSKYGCNIPLLLINTVNTHDATLKVLEKHSDKTIHTLIQSPYQRVNANDFMPYEGKIDSELSLFDHREILASLKNSGKLDELLLQGKEYLLVLNSDNLADVVDPKIINHLIQNNVEYCMEVRPTQSSNLEGNASHARGSKFKLREIGKMQDKKIVKPDEKIKLTDATNLWLDMKAILRLGETGALEKGNSPILKFFDRGIGINVPKTRYLPVEETSDLLLFQSDLFTCSHGILTCNEARSKSSLPSIELGPEFAKVSDFRSRLKSIPSIIELDSLKVTGDVWFGTGITLKGKVNITPIPGVKLVIPDGAVLENTVISSQRDIPEVAAT